ncbi:MAG TPA: hypothetical protein VIY48_00050 [Candidatus Paceibacterota bacterium]
MRFEQIAGDGQYVYAAELDLFTLMVYTMSGLKPKAWTVEVYRDSDMDENATMEECAPLHQEFFDDAVSAELRFKEVVSRINEGTFVYSPPVLPQL